MEIVAAAGLLREADGPFVIRVAGPAGDALRATLARFEAAGAVVTGTPNDTAGLHIEMGPVELAVQCLDPLTLTVQRTAMNEAGTRILFRVMASLGRSAGVEVTLAAVDRPEAPIFRYRPGGPGLDHVASGEVVAPYQTDDDA